MINDINSFRFIAHKVLPLVYDDSLSYYEFLCKVMQKLNEVIDNENEQNSMLEDMSDEIERFETEQDTKYNEFVEQVDQTLDDFEASMEAFEGEMETAQSQFESNMLAQFQSFLNTYQRTFGIIDSFGTSAVDAISQKCVSQLVDYENGDNLFDESTALMGKLLNSLTGAVSDNADFFTTNYIPIEVGAEYTAQYIREGVRVDTKIDNLTSMVSTAFYNGNLEYVSGPDGLYTSVVAPANTAYMRICFAVGLLSAPYGDFAIVKNATEVLPYEPYGSQDVMIKASVLPIDDTVASASVTDKIYSAGKVYEMVDGLGEEWGSVIGDIESDIANIEDDIDGLDSRVTTLEGTVQTLDNSISSLNGSVTNLTTRVGNAETDIDTVQGDIVNLSSDVTSLATSVAQMDTDVDTLQGQMASALSDISTLDSSVSSIESDITTLNDEVGDLGDDVSELSSTVSSLADELDYESGRIDGLNENLGIAQTDINNLEDDVSENTANISSLLSRMDTAEGDIDTLEGDVSGLDSRLDTAEDDIVDIKADIVALEDGKANKVGEEPDLISGWAKNILSDRYENNKVPYLTRPTSGSSNVKVMDRVKAVMYGSVVHNQLVQNGNFASSSNWTANANATFSVSNNVATITATAQGGGVTQSMNFIAGHKYFVRGFFKLTTGTTDVGIYIGSSQYGIKTINSTARQMVCGIWNCTSTQSNYIRILDKRTSDWDSFDVENVNVVDVTQYFGSAQIPDYLYSLEQSEAGSGIAKLHQWGFLRRPYYAYDAGTIKSSNPSFKTNVGRNLWDEQWELGSINANTGANVTSSNYIRSKNYIYVVPSMTYCVGRPTGKGLSIYEYDINKSYIGRQSIDSTGDIQTFSLGSNTAYIRFAIGGSTTPVTTYNHDICIFIHWDTDFDDDPYVEYKEWTYPIDSTVVGHGIFKLDENNNLYINGDTLASDRTNETRYDIIDLGTLNWSYSSTHEIFYSSGISASVKGVANTILANILCEKYIAVKGMDYNGGIDKSISIAAPFVSKGINIKDSTYSDAAAFKTAMSGVYLVYELAEPITSQKDGFTEIEVCDDWGIQYTNDKAFDDGESDVEIPVGFDSDFPINLVAKLEMMPDSPSQGNGDYVVRQIDGHNEYVKLVIPEELPTAPTTNGAYVLTATVTDGVVIYSWESTT